MSNDRTGRLIDQLIILALCAACSGVSAQLFHRLGQAELAQKETAHAFGEALSKLRDQVTGISDRQIEDRGRLNSLEEWKGSTHHLTRQEN